jgi:hypothetical protein
VSNLESRNWLDSEQRSLSYKLDEIKDKIEENKSEKNRIEDEIEESVRMRAYMVGLIEKSSTRNIYEIAKLDRYGNVSKRHAYLLTTETSFKSKGRFSMVVKEAGSMETKLRDEYGGFKQNWEVYIQSDLPNNPRENIDSIEEDLRELKVEKIKVEWLKKERDLEAVKAKKNIEEIFDGDDDFSTVGIAPVGKSKYEKSFGMAILGGGNKVLIMRSNSEEKIVWSNPSGLDTLSTSYEDTYFYGFKLGKDTKSIFYRTTDDKHLVANEWTGKEGNLRWVSITKGEKDIVDSDNKSKGLMRYFKSHPDVSNTPAGIEGMRYSMARKILVATGWKPYVGENEAEDLIGYPGKDSWDEISEGCSMGAVYCSFEFRNANGNELEVTTQGEVKDPVVVGWDEE